MKKPLHIILIFLLAFSNALAQGKRQQDSVEKLLKTLSRRDPARVDALVYLAAYYSENRMEHLNEALAIAENINYLKGQVDALSSLGSAIESEAKPDFARSREYYFKALPIAEKINDDSTIYVVYGQIFNASIYLGDYPKALEVCLTQLAKAEKTNNVRVMAGQYNNLGFLYTKQDNYVKAKEYLLKFLALAEKIGNESMLANACNNVAEIYEKEGNYKAALEKLFQALSVYERIHERKQKKEPGNKHMFQYIALTYNNIANLYRAEKDSKTALKYSLKCLDAAEQVSINKYDLSFFYITNGELRTLLGEFEKAKLSLEKGLAIAMEIDHKDDQKLAYLGLSEMYAAKGDHRSAVEYHVKYTDLKSTLLNEKNSKEMMEMNTKYESVKKDKEILKKDLELTEKLSRSNQKDIIRNASLLGFLLVALLAVFIYRGNIMKRKANEVILGQKNILEHKNKEVTDSIHYAKRIQKALLASESFLSKHLNEHFVLYKPKDIVSGDFYWAQSNEDKFMLCVADCTGHGVPGAFMSLLNISFLNEAVIEKKMREPNFILDSVRQSLINTLNSEGNENSKDGMDCVLCVFDRQRNKLIYAAANNTFYIIRNGQLILSKIDKMPVGRSPKEKEAFNLYEFDLEPNDMIYLLTDGYADQFGGPNGKKFRYKQLEELMLASCQLPMEEQKRKFDDALEKWKGDVEQVDDILMTGIRYKVS